MYYRYTKGLCGRRPRIRTLNNGVRVRCVAVTLVAYKKNSALKSYAQPIELQMRLHGAYGGTRTRNIKITLILLHVSKSVMITNTGPGCGI